MRYEHSLILRIVIAFLLPYKLFAFVIVPLTFWLTKAITSMFIGFETANHSIIIGNYWLNFITACAAVSAYYLLFFLIVLTKGIPLKKRLLMFLAGSLMILAMNIFRIELLIFILLKYGYNYFQAVHLIFWEVVSTLYVVATWIIIVNLFSVKEVPAYSDFKTIINKIKGSTLPGKE